MKIKIEKKSGKENQKRFFSNLAIGYLFILVVVCGGILIGCKSNPLPPSSSSTSGSSSSPSTSSGNVDSKSPSTSITATNKKVGVTVLYDGRSKEDKTKIEYYLQGRTTIHGFIPRAQYFTIEEFQKQSLSILKECDEKSKNNLNEEEKNELRSKIEKEYGSVLIILSKTQEDEWLSVDIEKLALMVKNTIFLSYRGVENLGGGFRSVLCGIYDIGCTEKFLSLDKNFEIKLYNKNRETGQLEEKQYNHLHKITVDPNASQIQIPFIYSKNSLNQHSFCSPWMRAIPLDGGKDLEAKEFNLGVVCNREQPELHPDQIRGTRLPTPIGQNSKFIIGPLPSIFRRQIPEILDHIVSLLTPSNSGNN